MLRGHTLRDGVGVTGVSMRGVAIERAEQVASGAVIAFIGFDLGNAAGRFHRARHVVPRDGAEEFCELFGCRHARNVIQPPPHSPRQR